MSEELLGEHTLRCLSSVTTLEVSMFEKVLQDVLRTVVKMVERKEAKRSVVLVSRQRWTLWPQGGELSAGIRLV